MKRFLVTPAIILSLLMPQIVFSDETDLPEEEWLYTDLDPNHVFADAIEFMTDNEYVEGYEDGTFKPDNTINRAEALKIIMLVSEISSEEAENVEEAIIDSADVALAEESEEETNEDLDEETSEETEEEIREMNFPDVSDENEWYYEYIKTAYEQNVVDGHDDGYFRPENTVNRAEAVKMFFASRNTPIRDSEEDEFWYEPYIEFATTNKALLIPDADGDYLPSQELTRGELCEIVYRFMNGIYTGETEYGVASYYGYSFDGANTASGTPLDAYGFMAAHKTLPFGTWVKVTNIANNMSVNVVIVDRGPYVEGRVIDLTPGAFEQISTLSSGLAHTYVEVLK